MTGCLDGKAIVVTGAGRGIGRAVAKYCATEGARVVVVDFGVGMHGDSAEEDVAALVAREIVSDGGTALPIRSSVTDMEASLAMVQAAVDRWGKIDGVVCTAGILRERMLFNMSEEEWDAVIATHLKGTFTLFRAAAPLMRAQGFGSLIGFTSAAFQASIAQANYSAAKGGIVSLVRSAAAGLHRYQVTANAIAPVARTRMMAQVPMELDENGEAEDIAPMVAYLLSDMARHITGQIYTVVGQKIAVWNQPRELRAMFAEGRWTPHSIAARLDSSIGQEPMPIMEQLERYREAAARAAETGTTPNA
jgi:NAD(P)-dependent dehydrogenase (short-subunit alcohol dehydrogenase family)